MKKLELIHLTTYFPYNLRLANYNNTHTGELKAINTSFDITISYNPKSDGENLRDNNLYYKDELQFKPILRPLSDLIKQIEIDGKKIIPIVELAKLEYPNYKKLMLLNKSETDYNYSIQFKTDNDMTIKMCVGSYNKNGIQTILNIDCYGSDGKASKMFSRSFIRDVVIKWHFDIYCLIDHKLAVDINTFTK
jgi:hypothetical protein